MMKQPDVTKHIFNFQKSVFDHAFDALQMVHNQNERVLKIFLDNSNGIPEKGKQAALAWMDFLKKGQHSLKSTVDERFRDVEAHIFKEE